MGEVAEMMLDGTLCEGCGVYLGIEDAGFPCLCESCASERREDGSTVRDTGLGAFQDVTPAGNRFEDALGDLRRSERIPCPECGKRVARCGLEDHRAAKHGRQ